MKRGLLVFVLLLFLAGCGKHYWSRAGASADDFAKDSKECTRAAAIAMANKDYGIVKPEYYKACMKGLGWARDQHPEPPPPGWYRGLEREELVKLDAPLPQPSSAPPPPPPAR
jgi:hypothetical protein